MKKTIILHSIGNERDFNYYIFDKKQVVAEILSKLFYKNLTIEWRLYDIDTNKKINIEKYKDVHQAEGSISNKSRVDIFYGNKKMFIVVYCSEKLRLKFNEELFKIVKMPKPIKIKRIT